MLSYILFYILCRFSPMFCVGVHFVCFCGIFLEYSVSCTFYFFHYCTLLHKLYQIVPYNTLLFSILPRCCTYLLCSIIYYTIYYWYTVHIIYASVPRRTLQYPFEHYFTYTCTVLSLTLHQAITAPGCTGTPWWTLIYPAIYTSVTVQYVPWCTMTYPAGSFLFQLCHTMLYPILCLYTPKVVTF